MIIAIIQARMGSTRLPNKVMMDFVGNPNLYHVVNRVRKSNLIDKVVVATTVNVSDDKIEEFCTANDISYFRGSENDVLDRFYQCALNHGASNGDRLVRITADCPLIDASIIDEVIKLALEGDYDYASNVEPPTFPDGLDTEVVKFEVLEKVWDRATLKSDREHVTTYIRNSDTMFKKANYRNETDQSDLRWTLDENEDYEFIRLIYSHLYPINPDFLKEDVIEYLKANPEISGINSKFFRNEGLLKSLENDGLR